MPTTLLAIDDSVTMRKVLEMTFAGEDYRVVIADGIDSALNKLRAERPAIVVCDVTLDGTGGYGLCAKIKADNPAVAVLLLASKQQPYDSQKGGQARADDFIEKPFDTQQLLEKVKRLVTRPGVEVAAPPPAPVARPAAPPTPPPAPAPARPAPAAPMAAAPAARPPVPTPLGAGGGLPGASARPIPTAAQQVGRGTLAYGGPIPMPPPPAGEANAGRDAATAPPARPHAPPAPPAAAAVGGGPLAGSAITTNGHLAAQLATLGLTEAQVTAVLALSREVVEKVVWEVVPVLAETMIQEEIRRLTSE